MESLLWLNFNFISPSNCFYLDLKITSLVFLTLREILSALINFSALTNFIIIFQVNIDNFIEFFNDLPKYNKLVLSAKWWCTWQNFIAWLRSLLYNNERSEDRTLRNTTIFFSKLRVITIYRSKLVTIREVGFKPVIWYTSHTILVKFR